MHIIRGFRSLPKTSAEWQETPYHSEFKSFTRFPKAEKLRTHIICYLRPPYTRLSRDRETKKSQSKEKLA